MELETIWKEYRASLRAFLSTKISNTTDVEDLLQEVLIKTHGGIGRLEKTESIKAWLFQVANRTVIDFYRKRNRPSEEMLGELWHGSDEENIKLELSHCIEPFLRVLNDDEANLLRLIDLEGVSQKRFAAEQGLSYSTLKSRVQKSRLALRALFDQCCQYEVDAHGSLMEVTPKSKACREC